MPVLGQAEPRTIAPGAAKLAEYQAAGFTPQELAKYKADKSQEYLNAGFSVPEVEAHWGDQSPHSPEVAAYVANNVQKSQGWGAVFSDAGSRMASAAQSAASAVAHPLQTVANLNNAIHNMHPLDAFEAGWGTSVTGIIQHEPLILLMKLWRKHCKIFLKPIFFI